VDVVQVSPDGRELRALLGAALGGHHSPLGGAAAPTPQQESGPAARRLLGIVGAPGSGKSTLAVALASLLPDAVVVPMDGFHLADVELRRRGVLERKGAPETFDGWGYAALLERLRRAPRAGEIVMAPGFERDLEQPLAGAIPVPTAASRIVTEGNYLLLDTPEWRAARSALDEVWFVRTDDDVRRQRLVARHIAFGKPPHAARAWVDAVDEPNARLVAESADRADLIVDLSDWQPG
jgi:pantothenate kinase